VALDGSYWTVLHPGDLLPGKESQGWLGRIAGSDAVEWKINCSLVGIERRFPGRAVLPRVALVIRGLFVCIHFRTNSEYYRSNHECFLVLGYTKHVATVTLLRVKYRCSLLELMCVQVSGFGFLHS
jgi:hypothetical protein